MLDRCAHITIIINKSLVKKILTHLSQLGINDLYSSFGRSIILSDARGISAIFRSSDLLSEPVEVLYFYIPIQHEQAVMRSVVKFSRLDIPGRGSIFSKHMSTKNGHFGHLVCELNLEKLTNSADETDTSLYPNLIQIHCTMSKGLADDVARLLLHLGVVPTVTNASGTGLRDEIGLLRITIPKEKELLSIVVGHHEANTIMEKIIHWGKLDRPGRGFIWQVPVELGLINFKNSQRSIGQVATSEQIISAIDSLKGNFSWRQGNPSLSGSKRRDFFKGTELLMQVKDGGSLPISRAMIKLGISGATVQSLKTISSENQEQNIIVPQEIVRVVVTDEQALRLRESLSGSSLLTHELKEIPIFTLPVKKAFNYRKQK